ncbi:MAG: pectate lyase [Cyanobium sp.]
MLQSPLTAAKRSLQGLDLRPLLILAVLYGVVQWLPFQIFGWLQNEDGLMEWASFAVLCLAAVEAGRMLKRGCRSRIERCGWLLLLCLLILFAGEEIAWGERLHGLGIDAIRSINTQEETTLHNIREFQNRGLLNLGWSIFALSLASGWRLWPAFSPWPARRQCLYFLIPGLWYAAFHACSKNCPVVVANHQEVYEFLIALGLYLHTRCRWQERRRSEPPSP